MGAQGRQLGVCVQTSQSQSQSQPCKIGWRPPRCCWHDRWTATKHDRGVEQSSRGKGGRGGEVQEGCCNGCRCRCCRLNWCRQMSAQMGNRGWQLKPLPSRWNLEQPWANFSFASRVVL